MKKRKKEFIGKEPATLENSVDCSFTDAVSFGKGRAIPKYQSLYPDVAEVHGAPPLVSVHLYVAAHGLDDTLGMGLGQWTDT